MLDSYDLLPAVREFAQREHLLLIDGEWVPASDGGQIDVIDPASGGVLTKVAAATADDVDRAVEAAARARHGKWGKLSASRRAKLLWAIADLIDQHADELAQLESLDTGKPILEARWGDIAGAAAEFRYFAGWCTKWTGEVLPISSGEFLTYTRREPVGVVGAITAWNFPMLLAVWKIAPALATGNTIVLKPSEVTPLTCLRLGELIQDAGVPDGVVNIVPGYGHIAGAAIANHPKVNKISFTGSKRTGRQLMIAAAEDFKRITLELGGKSPNIVFADADIQAAVRGAMAGIFFNQGEVCAAGSRLFVERSRFDELVDGIVGGAEKLKARQGAGVDPATKIGPLVSKEHMDRVLGYIEKGRSEGAELLTGGGVNADAGSGFFVEPTVFVGKDELTIAREEIFGPVLTVLPFDDLDEVAERANRTTYGLAAGIWTSDLRRALKLAHRLEAGTVWINSYNMFDASSPWGGFKQSGIGREKGRYALEAYTEVKSVWVNLEESDA
ncbi:MAG: aldehyde dehydrogenase family protein [Candidatus Dadabacteria bacterium]|nr:MAG: aldehyde dehydrogenase family protein [Candidatus Dadabacteria bacterium]